MKKVAFVCVHNSCRSQIAEALAKKFGAGVLEVYSAGTEVKDKINGDAVRLVKNIYGIDMTISQRPKLLRELPEVDYFITMGCNVVCPSLDYSCEREDWGLMDPSVAGDEVFLEVIKIIERKVLELVNKVKSRG